MVRDSSYRDNRENPALRQEEVDMAEISKEKLLWMYEDGDSTPYSGALQYTPGGLLRAQCGEGSFRGEIRDGVRRVSTHSF